MSGGLPEGPCRNDTSLQVDERRVHKKTRCSRPVVPDQRSVITRWAGRIAQRRDAGAGWIGWPEYHDAGWEAEPMPRHSQQRSLLRCLAQSPRGFGAAGVPKGPGALRRSLDRSDRTHVSSRVLQASAQRILMSAALISAKKASSPLSVNGWLIIDLMTPGGAVITSAPRRALSRTWFTDRIEAARISVSNP